MPRSVQKRNPEGGGKATIISHLLDTELQSFLSQRNILEKCMQARYTENPEQETGLEKDKKRMVSKNQVQYGRTVNICKRSAM